MSKRNDRRAAEREVRKLAYQKLRIARQQSDLQQGDGIEQSIVPEAETSEPETAELETSNASNLPARAQASLETRPDSEPAATERNSISEAQLTANRANSKLSTGAVTPAGRAKSSMNALKNGLTGKTVLLPHEDADQYQHDLDAYIEVHKPATDDEHRLVQSLIDCIWRLQRINRLETGILLKGHIEFANKFEDRTPLERSHLIEAEAYLKYEKQIRNLNIQEARLRRTMDKDRAELLRLQTVRKREELAAIQSQTRSPKPQNQAQAADGFEFSAQPIAASTRSKSKAGTA